MTRISSSRAVKQTRLCDENWEKVWITCVGPTKRFIIRTEPRFIRPKTDGWPSGYGASFRISHPDTGLRAWVRTPLHSEFRSFSASRTRINLPFYPLSTLSHIQHPSRGEPSVPPFCSSLRIYRMHVVSFLDQCNACGHLKFASRTF
jgi:hypothetical protein